jgi:hypothetical protein
MKPVSVAFSPGLVSGFPEVQVRFVVASARRPGPGIALSDALSAARQIADRYGLVVPAFDRRAFAGAIEVELVADRTLRYSVAGRPLAALKAAGGDTAGRLDGVVFAVARLSAGQVPIEALAGAQAALAGLVEAWALDPVRCVIDVETPGTAFGVDEPGLVVHARRPDRKIAAEENRSG